jgi:hypothetical protein
VATTTASSPGWARKGVDVGVSPNVVVEQPFVAEPADGRIDLILTDVAQAFDRERAVAHKSRTTEADAAAAQAQNPKSEFSVFIDPPRVPARLSQMLLQDQYNTLLCRTCRLHSPSRRQR